MTRLKPWALLFLGFSAGAVTAAVVLVWALRPSGNVQGSPFLEQLDIPALAGQAGAGRPEMIEDQVRRHVRSTLADDFLLPERRAWAVTRQVVARLDVPRRDQLEFGKKFHQELLRALAEFGPRSGSGTQSSVALPITLDDAAAGRYVFSSSDGYRVGATPGCFQIYLVGDGDVLTLFLNVVEGN